MTIQSWDTSLIGVDPSDHARSVLAIPGTDGIVDQEVLDELRNWGWTVTVVHSDVSLETLELVARSHDVALFGDIRGTRAARRALTPILPTVAVVPARGHGRVAALLAEAGTSRDTTVLVVRDPRDVRILRKLSAAALVRAEAGGAVPDRAAALAAVLLRAYAWQLAPTGPSHLRGLVPAA